MGLSFHWQNLVLLTQRTSISKLLKPNFLYQTPETSTNFHRIIHFFPLKKKKEEKRKTRTAFECLFPGKPGMERHSRAAAACVPAADVSLHSVLPGEGQKPSSDKCPLSSRGASAVFTRHNCCLLIKHRARAAVLRPAAGRAGAAWQLVSSHGTKQASSLLLLLQRSLRP